MLKKILEVKENFQISTALMKRLLVDSEEIVAKIAEQGIFQGKALDINYFQSEHSDRNELKQDFTPDGICRIVAEIAEGGSVLDVCAGVGGLSIPLLEKTECLYLEEISERAIPFLLLNLAFNNVNAFVFHKDVLTGEIFHRYRLTEAETYSKIEEIEEGGEYESVQTVIMNPPYSLKWENQKAATDKRFSGYAVAPSSKADYAFLLHGLFALKEKGQLIAVIPQGVLFRGGKEGEIRQKLIEENLLDSVIRLPDKMFLNTGICVCLMIFKKNREREDILIIDASKEFISGKKQNEMSEEQIQKLLSVYRHRLETAKYSAIVSGETTIT